MKTDYDYVECGCCQGFHRFDFYGDCRMDDERLDYGQLPDNAIIYTVEEQTFDCEG